MRHDGTCHFACDCREEKFKKLEVENAKMRAALEWIALGPTFGGEEAPSLAEQAVMQSNRAREVLGKKRGT